MSRFRFHSDPEALYVWNTRLTKSFLEDIQHIEVLLRNHVDRTLSEHPTRGGYGPQWFLSEQIPFTQPAQRSISKALARAGFANHQADTGKVVAELSFDFWYFLFTATYTTTVWPKIARTLRGGISRERFRKELKVVYDLRNRCAHHEPVINANSDIERKYLDRCQEAIFNIANAIDSSAANWISGQSRVRNIRSHRP